MDKHLHIVTHDVPWPADFGGVFDLFYKIKALHQAGIKIHLHCYTHQRYEQSMLNRYCASVDYYPRIKKLSFFQNLIPYIVQSRRSKKLLANLLKDDYPILLEGMHCTFHLYNGLLNKKNVFVRLHNVEHRYYKKLFSHERNLLKKTYYFIESILLLRYEKRIVSSAPCWTVSKTDLQYFKEKKYAAKELNFLPVFIPWNEIHSTVGIGNFCLYHGNLSINENEEVACWLIDAIFCYINIPLVIAGKNPSEKLKKKVYEHPNMCLVENPSDFELSDLIKKAQINVLPSFNETGVKLKLLNALFNGRHCLVNAEGAAGSMVENLCHLANSAESFKNKIEWLYQLEFSKSAIEERKEQLQSVYNNQQGAEKIISWLY